MVKKKAIDARVFDAVFATIDERHEQFVAGKVDSASRTHKLFEAGVPKIAQKLGEEAVETLIEAVRGRKKPLIEESADLLYFLAVIWAANDVTPKHVWKELAERHGLPEELERAMREASKTEQDAS
ncbi:MAG: phosphoribosyl-ATP diphosphatase [Alphaproteobacteria bacterium]